jgi:hypothetical protein
MVVGLVRRTGHTNCNRLATAGYFQGIVDDIFVLITNLFLVIPALLIIWQRACTQTQRRDPDPGIHRLGTHARIRAMTLSLREKITCSLDRGG